MSKDRAWADEDDEDEYETSVDVNGIKERVKTTINEKGQRVKTVQRIKVQEIKKRTPKGIAERRNFPKFGDAVKDIDNVSREIAIMEYPMEEEKIDPDVLANASLSAMQFRQEGREREAAATEHEEEPVDKYEVKRSEPLETALRVSNLSKTVTEDDLRELFSRYGSVQKVSLPRQVTPTGAKEVRGFAYITYLSRSDAERAMEALDGKGFDHLILKLEWAKPPSASGPHSGGLSSGYVSGYGQKLAQDTKEKVVFTSHGSSNS